jgi:hypothetical protein
MALNVPKGRPPQPPQRKPQPATSVAKVVTAPTAIDATMARIDSRREGLVGLAQIGAFFATIQGRFADVGTINMYGEDTCREVALIGEESALIGKGLDMLAAAGPYTKLLTTAVPMVLQFMANRGKIDWKAASQLGVMDPQLVAEKAKADIRAMAEAAAREAQLAQQRAAQDAARAAREHEERMNGQFSTTHN